MIQARWVRAKISRSQKHSLN